MIMIRPELGEALVSIMMLSSSVYHYFALRIIIRLESMLYCWRCHYSHQRLSQLRPARHDLAGRGQVRHGAAADLGQGRQHRLECLTNT
jgi:hypothetical protein